MMTSSYRHRPHHTIILSAVLQSLHKRRGMLINLIGGVLYYLMYYCVHYATPIRSAPQRST